MRVQNKFTSKYCESKINLGFTNVGLSLDKICFNEVFPYTAVINNIPHLKFDCILPGSIKNMASYRLGNKKDPNNKTLQSHLTSFFWKAEMYRIK